MATLPGGLIIAVKFSKPEDSSVHGFLPNGAGADRDRYVQGSTSRLRGGGLLWLPWPRRCPSGSGSQPGAVCP